MSMCETLSNEQLEVLNKLVATKGHVIRKKFINKGLQEIGSTFKEISYKLLPFRNEMGLYNVAQFLKMQGVTVATSNNTPAFILIDEDEKEVEVKKKEIQIPLVKESKKNNEPVIACVEGNYQAYVPEIDPLYVPFGHFNDIKNIIKSKVFYPFYVSGLSGNGKTFMIEQACAAAGREYMRVNFTKNTDEDDLFGGFRLIDGETVWFDGPVIKAMRSGALLLLDEIDLSSTAALCLQPVLEGKGVLLKKINEFVKPQPGFNIAATANTKGKGCDDGRFVGANVLNEAFLERFPLTFEQEYPTVKVEEKILSAIFDSMDIKDNEFVEILTKWSDVVRKTFLEGAINELISTRRLVHIAKAYGIFNDKEKAINLCISRFDAETKGGLMKLYNALIPQPITEQPPVVENKSEDGLEELEEIKDF